MQNFEWLFYYSYNNKNIDMTHGAKIFVEFSEIL